MRNEAGPTIARMVVITPESFDPDEEYLLAPDSLVDFLRDQADLTDGHRSALHLCAVMNFYGKTESEALSRSARWMEKNVDGVDIFVIASYFRFIDEDVEGGLNYVSSFVLEIA